MNQVTFYCPKEPGATTIQKFLNVIQALKKKHINRIKITTSLKSFEEQAINYDDIRITPAINQSLEFYSKYPEQKLKELSIYYTDNNNSRINKITYSNVGNQIASSTITINTIGSNIKIEDVFNALSDEFSLLDNDEVIFEQLPDFYKKQAMVYHKNLEDMQTALAKLQTSIINQKENNDQYLHTEKERLSTELNEKKSELQTAFNEKFNQLDKEKKELEERKKSIDDRESKHARREIRKDMRTNIIEKRQSEFKLTAGTSRKRYIIHAAFFIIFTTLCACLIHSIYVNSTSISVVSITANQTTSPTTNYYILEIIRYFKIPFLLAAIIALGIYYIKWNDLWFRRHADEEFKLKQFELDFERASWVVEMAMEWNEEKDTEIPEELLNRLTQGLFDNETGNSKSPKHISEDVLSMLLKATELNLNVPGVNAKFNRKGTKQLEKAIR